MLIIRTCARDGADYLPQLVDQVEAEGLRGIILTDGERPRVFEGWTSVCTRGPIGGRLCGWAALGLIANTGEDTLLLEDDVVPVPGGVSRMLHTPVPDHLAFLSFFDIRIVEDRTPGIRQELCQEFMQAQALKIPARTARAVYKLDPQTVVRAGFDPRHAFDLCLGVLCAEQGLSRYGVVYPNLVDHRGKVSAVDPGRRWELRSGWVAGG